MALRLITGPTLQPFTLDEFKQHARISTSDDDVLLETYRDVVRLYLEGKDGILGRCLSQQTWELALDAFPPVELKLPLAPLQSVVSVKYDDLDGNEQTIDPLHYDVDTYREPGWIVPKRDFSWPTTFDAINAVRIRYVCGYGSNGASPPAPAYPPQLKLAMFRMMSDLYEFRETAVTGTISAVIADSATVNAMLASFIVPAVGDLP